MLNALYFPAERSRSKKLEVSVSSSGPATEFDHLELLKHFEGKDPKHFTVTKFPGTLPIALDHNFVIFFEREVRNMFAYYMCLTI